MAVVTVYLATEDALSEAVLRKIIAKFGRSVKAGQCFRKEGFGYLEKSISAFNHASEHIPFFVLRDLDDASCPPELIGSWLGPLNRHPNLLIHIAVRQVESWMLAHREAFADHFSVPKDTLPRSPDELDDAKRFLIELIRRKSKRRSLRDDIAPSLNSTAKQGRNYNAPLCSFANDIWDPQRAMSNSPSLSRAVRQIEKFVPISVGAHPDE
jgi:hypothetical protein